MYLASVQDNLEVKHFLHFAIEVSECSKCLVTWTRTWFKAYPSKQNEKWRFSRCQLERPK